jgi:hypothetical protein
MATTATTFFGNRARAAVVAAGGTPALADLVTVTRGFEVSIAWETAELYGTDDIRRVDEAKHTLKPEAKLKGCKFDPLVTTGTGIMKHVLATLFGAASGTGVITNTNIVYLMDVYIYITGSADPTNNKFCIKLTNCYLEGVPFPFPENDFMMLDLSFKARTGALTNDAVPVA